MKSLLKPGILLCGALLLSELSFSQVNTNHSLTESKKSLEMDILKIQTNNKEAIRNLYESILNKRKFEHLNTLISEEYSNVQGGKGVEGFKKPLIELINAFPDVHWEVQEMIAEGNKVIVKQKTQGIQTGQFQNIAATNKSISNDGIGIYEFKNGKIIHHQIQTDRLGFLQQLGVLPVDISTLSQKKENKNTVYFIDKFFVPKNSIEEFAQRMKYNRGFIKNLEGFIRDEAYEQKDEEGNLTIITIAVWQSQDDLNNAKSIVQAEYKRIEFNPIEFNKRLNIKMERGIYNSHKEK